MILNWVWDEVAKGDIFSFAPPLLPLFAPLLEIPEQVRLTYHYFLDHKIGERCTLRTVLQLRPGGGPGT